MNRHSPVRPPAARFAALALAGGAAACAGGNTADLTGTTGLAGALPGGDGRQLAAYRSEFSANALLGLDSLMLRFGDVWQRDDRGSIGAVYAPNVTLLTPDGHLMAGGEPVSAWVESQLPLTSRVELWRDDFTASGVLGYMYGRYESAAVGPGLDHKGVHLTLAERDGRTWRIRSTLLLSFGGAGPAAPPQLLRDDPPHVSPEAIREAFGRRATSRREERAEWMVDAYLFANSVMSQWRHHWSEDDARAALRMLSPTAVVRLPWDGPTLGVDNVGASLARLLPAVGELHMSILDFERSERLSYCLGRYVLTAGAQQFSGYYGAVIQQEDDGPRIRALLFSGAGANERPVPTGDAPVR